jgi:cytochrome c oxidase subunit 2
MVVLMTSKHIVLLLALLPAAGHVRAASIAEVEQPASPPRVIHVVAERFAFTPAEITLEEGTAVELRITSDDTDHGFRIRGLGDPNVAIPKRGRGDVRITLDAPAAGRYTFECSHVCGAGHGFMRGVIRVTPRSSR